MKELGIDPKKYKYLSSDDKSTTLQHTNGHTLRIMHNVLAPKNQEILKALSKTSQDEPKKMADGGDTSDDTGYSKTMTPQEQQESNSDYAKAQGNAWDKVHGTTPQSQQAPTLDPRTWWANGGKVSDSQPKMNRTNNIQGTTPEPGYTKMADGGTVDAGLPCLNPNCKSQGKPHPNCRCYSGGEAYARGGEVSKLRYCAHGMPHKHDCMYAKGGPVPQMSPGSTMAANVPRMKDGGDVHKVQGGSYEDLPPDDSQSAQTPDNSQDDSQPNMSLPQDDSQQNMSTGKATPPEPSQQTQAAATPDQSQTSPQGANSTPQTQQNPESQLSPQAQRLLAQASSPEALAKGVGDNLMDEGRNWSMDISNGHIQPKTYRDLFNHADGTLGKIGSLFSMLLSGAGSGLAHQPNVLIGMMDKVIDNDLKAQESSATNRQNYIKMAQQHALNNASILATKAGVKLTEAQTAAALQDTKFKTKMYMQRSAVADLYDKVNAMPEGAPKQQGLAALAMLSGKLDNENSDMASKIGAAKALAVFGDAGSSQSNEDAYQRQQFMLRRGGQKDWADQNDKQHVPGVGNFSQPVDEKSREVILGHQKLDAGIQNLYSKIDKYATLNHLSPAYIQGQEEVRKLQADLREGLLGTVYREGEQPLLDQLISMPPAKVLDYRTKAQLQSLKQINDRDFNVLKKQHGYLGPGPGNLPSPNTAAQPASQNSLEGKTASDAKGNKIIMKNGKWVPYGG